MKMCMMAGTLNVRLNVGSEPRWGAATSHEVFTLCEIKKKWKRAENPYTGSVMYVIRIRRSGEVIAFHRARVVPGQMSQAFLAWSLGVRGKWDRDIT